MVLGRVNLSIFRKTHEKKLLKNNEIQNRLKKLFFHNSKIFFLEY